MSRPRIPRSTYRLQFNGSFTFADARAIADYLSALGISDCYASSYFAAVPGSHHGYDVTDPTRLNPELGTDADYWAWIDTLKAHDMGHLLDLVPNHMGIAKSSNPWWLDVLENGPSSRFAHFFDIEWHPVKDELTDKVLIPILGDQYGAVLERQELELQYRDGSFHVRYFDDVLPVAPDTFSTVFGASLERWLAKQSESGRADADELQSLLAAGRNLPSRSSRDAGDTATRAREKEVVKRRLAALTERSEDVRALVSECVRQINGRQGEPRSFDRLDALLNEQSYRLAHWRVASEEINYRRFFDVNELAALRMEDPTVFDEVHHYAFELVRRGAATGLRVDHVDGLYAPGDYLRRLQARCPALYVVVEKILEGDEPLPPDWPVHGTTGYEFAATVNNLFVDRRNERALSDIYTRFVRERRERLSFADLAYRTKKQVMHETMSGDINSLGHQLNVFSERNRHFRDFTLYSLISTIKELIACFPVYRTYVTQNAPISDRDRRYIVEAVQTARRRAPHISSVVFDFIERVLLKKTSASTSEEQEERAAFIGKFQQITSPVAAKGIEDSALYVYNRLLSLNEVGADPTRFGLEPSVVHEWLRCRQRRWPRALSTTTTHDSKRGEDVKARLNVLSEIPGTWKTAVAKWRAVNRRFKREVGGAPAPDPNQEYFLYQTLVGAWPFHMAEGDDALFRDRIVAYMIKAMRESKAHTSWLSPDEEYEHAVRRFIESILSRRSSQFLDLFLPFQARVAELGIYNSLSQLLIKITAPGIPDFYQGGELWDLNLVDPDNRRPVDYGLRREMLDSVAHREDRSDADLASALLDHRTDGRIKMFVTNRALSARADNRELFDAGDYVPLEAVGARREHVFGFARQRGTDAVIICVPRLIASLASDATPPLGLRTWSDTLLELPEFASRRAFRDVFTGVELRPTEGAAGPTIEAAALFDRFPIALLLPLE